MSLANAEFYTDLLVAEKLLNVYSLQIYNIWTLAPMLRIVKHLDYVNWTGIPDKLNVVSILTAIRKEKQAIQRKMLPSYIKIWRPNVGTLTKFIGHDSGVIRCECDNDFIQFTVFNQYHFKNQYRINDQILFNVEFSDFERKWIAIKVNKY